MTQRDGTTYRYNADGVLATETISGSTTISYTQDLAAPLSQILQTIDGGTTTDHLYGLERLTTESSGTRTWYGADALGSVRQTLNASGTVLSSINYDLWGQVESGTTPGFGFTGEMQDAAGLVYLRARWYNPGQALFSLTRRGRYVHIAANSAFNDPSKPFDPKLAVPLTVRGRLRWHEIGPCGLRAAHYFDVKEIDLGGS